MEVTIDCYEITKCGYYKRRGTKSVFGNAEDIIADLQSWLIQSISTIDQTKTFNQSEDSDQLPVYCYDVKKNNDTGDYLFTIWNENETLDGSFASVEKDGAIGDAIIDKASIPDNSIPGFPTYFWIAPSIGKIFCIRYKSRVTGMRGFCKYLRGYLEHFSKWTVIQGEDKSLDSTVLGHSDTNEVKEKVYPDFKAGLSQVDGEIKYIKDNYSQITKLIRKDEFISSKRDNKGLGSMLMTNIGLKKKKIISSSAKYKFQLDFVPTKSDIEEIIKFWEQDTEHTKWDDIGFKFKDGKTRWLGHAQLRSNFDLKFTMRENGLINNDELLRSLTNKREEIFKKFGFKKV